MKTTTCIAITLVVAIAIANCNVLADQQRILRRVIKSTPTATNLGRIRQVTVRSTESGGVAEISSKEAANFGQRSTNENEPAPQPKPQALVAGQSVKTKQTQSTTTTSTSNTTSTPSTTSTTTTTPIPSTSTLGSTKPDNSPKNRASERQQAAGSEVELLSSAPSSWQTMTAVEAPAAMLIATGVRPAQDLASSSSNNDLLRASTKGNQLNNQEQEFSTGQETFSRLRQQQSSTTTTNRQQQSFFYPQSAPSKTQGKTSTGTKSHWYQTTPRPAPIIQEQHYEQQKNEQFVEQQAEYNAAPPGEAEPFAFDFNTKDSNGNGQYRKEESDKNGVVHGSYGYTDANGIYRHVEYVADENGFRANIKSNEPGLIGETQPASIQLAGGAASPSSRLTEDGSNSGNWNSNDSNEASSLTSADVTPNFESSHKPERIRAARHFRN